MNLRMKTNPPDISPFSIWLLPEAESFAFLKGIIRTCAAKNGGPLFDPHLTVCSLQEAVAPQKNFPPQTLTNQGLVFSDQYFQSAVLHVSMTQEIQDFRGQFTTAPWQPHVSLFYGWNPPQMNLNSEQLPTKITFDRMALIQLSPDVEKWEKRWMVPLS